MVRDELRKQRRINDYNELWSKVQLSKSYEEALGYIREVVTLIDEDNKNVWKKSVLSSSFHWT